MCKWVYAVRRNKRIRRVLATVCSAVFNLERNIVGVRMVSGLSVFLVEDKVDLDRVSHQPHFIIIIFILFYKKWLICMQYMRLLIFPTNRQLNLGPVEVG